MRTRRLNRRAMLRGLGGAAIALPTLEVMLDGTARPTPRARRSEALPGLLRRHSRWAGTAIRCTTTTSPTPSGANYDLKSALAPLGAREGRHQRRLGPAHPHRQRRRGAGRRASRRLPRLLAQPAALGRALARQHRRRRGRPRIRSWPTPSPGTPRSSRWSTGSRSAGTWRCRRPTAGTSCPTRATRAGKRGAHPAHGQPQGGLRRRCSPTSRRPADAAEQARQDLPLRSRKSVLDLVRGQHRAADATQAGRRRSAAPEAPLRRDPRPRAAASPPSPPAADGDLSEARPDPGADPPPRRAPRGSTPPATTPTAPTSATATRRSGRASSATSSTWPSPAT